MAVIKSLLIGLAVYVFYRVFINIFMAPKSKSSSKDEVSQLKVCSRCGVHVEVKKISYIDSKPVCVSCFKK